MIFLCFWLSLVLAAFVYSKKIICKENFNYTNKRKCIGAEFSLGTFNEEAVFSVLPLLDKETNLQTLIISVDPIQNFTEYGEKMDQFLTPRPWWRITKEPYYWKTTYDNNLIILKRFPLKMELGYQFLASVQYADSKTCEKMQFSYSTQAMANPGWGVIIPRLVKEIQTSPTRVFAMYGSVSNQETDETAYMGSDECHEHINKWLCAFLPTTNCSIPVSITNCSEMHCTGAGGFATNASLQGERVKRLDPQGGKEPYNEKQRELIDNAATMKNNYVVEYLLRLSASMRSRVARMLEQMRVEFQINEEERFAAAHVRRGDRVLSGVNMTEFCLNLNSSNPRGGDSARHGCNANRPYGGYSMSDVVEEAEKMVDPSIRTLIVASDDFPWLISGKKEVSVTHPDWKVAFVPPPSPPPDYKTQHREYYEGYRFIRSEGGSVSGAYLFAQMASLQGADVFLGHFGSTATVLFASRVCNINSRKIGLCVPTHNFG